MDAKECSEDIGQNLLRIDQLELSNYRCFTQCAVDFHPSLTVLVAENAKGKSAILDAIAIALDPIIATIVGGQSIRFPIGAIHLSKNETGKMKPAVPARVQAKGSVANRESISWARELAGSSKRSRPSSRELKSVVAASSQFIESSKSGSSSVLPVVAYYRTDRLWTSQGDRSRPKGASDFTGRLVGYQDWSSPTSSFGSFIDWYRSAFTDLGASTSKFRDKEDRLEKQLAAIHDAISTALEPTGWRSITWQGHKSNDDDQIFEDECIAVEHSTKGMLPLQYLSDGVKNMISLVADLSYRCVRLNPELGMDASNGTPGVVLIDEIDMHLHPRWQQVVVELLTSAFPRVQFIVTTHSPQVLSTVDYQSIRLVHLEGSKGVVRKPEYQTRGIESADILARLMDVDPIPHVRESQWLSEYRALLQTAKHETNDGGALWEKIVNHFGQNNPVLDEFETLRRFQAFRHTQGLNKMMDSSDA
jgi:predicted ATP-binding protein involved in virulence